MKRVVLAVFALVAVLGLAGCGGSPGTVVKDFSQYVASGKVNDAAGLLSSDGRKLLDGMGGATSILLKMTDEVKQHKGLKSVVIVKEEITGDTAAVQYKLVYEDGQTKEDDEKLIKEGGKWRIAVSK